MNLKEIRDEAYDIAREVGTTDADRLWTKKEMNRYINRVYRFVARETKCIRDAITPAVCRIDVAPPVDLAALEALALTDASYADDLVEYNREGSWMYNTFVAPRIFPLHPSILDIDEVKWHDLPWKLTKVSVTKWQINPKWEQVTGYPTEVATDYSTGYLAVNYRFSGTDSIRMTVKRMPLVDLVADTDVPELKLQYHDFMINGILAQMYGKQDAETFDKDQIAKYTMMYAADVDNIKQQEATFDQRLRPNTSLDAFR